MLKLNSFFDLGGCVFTCQTVFCLFVCVQHYKQNYEIDFNLVVSLNNA